MSERDVTLADDGACLPHAAPGALLRRVRRRVHARLAALQNGRLDVRDPLGEASFGGAGALQAAIHVRDLSAYLDVAMRGTVGAAEAYMRGKWSASDLTTLVRVLVANRPVLDGLERGLAALAAPVLRLTHWRRRNTRSQSRRNIGAHYDLGNDFYRLFLDPTMSYSAAIYPRAESTLEEAAVHKLDLVCRKLELGPDDHLLEIGTGWGGLALHAARHYGCRVTTTTISQRQRAYALERVREAGLEERITVLDRDYRDLEGRYDKLVSVEMIEAVGLGYLEHFFRVCSERLAPHGRMLLQGIVIADRLYEQARRSVDFIQRYIFPGGALPSLGAIQTAAARATDLQLVALQDISQHYARTLRAWRERFLAQLPAVRQLGHPEEFIRMWEYYLAYCEGGFLERAISDVQLVFDKPGCRLAPPGAAGALPAG
jgi:cyclopropane-fatty-acyl-phospholipid synthase